MKLFGGRGTRSPGGANGSSGTPLLDEIEELTRVNRDQRDPEVEARLVRMRHEAFAKLERHDGPAPMPEPDCGGIEWIDGVPAVAPDRLSAVTLRAGILEGGCVLVRGLLTPERIERTIAGIDRSFAARDVAQSGGAAEPGWYEPLTLGGGAYNLERQRQWVTSAGGVWTADSPRVTFELIELFAEVGLLPVMADYLGERPVASVNKWTLRRVSPGGDGDWHQDGAFLGTDIRAINVWLSLSDCGVDAPGMDLVPRRLDRIVETGTEGARFDWSVSPAVARELLDGSEPVRPAFQAGDVLLFDELFLHQTAQSAEMTRDRYAVETWCFGPSAYPAKQVPLVL